MVQKGKSKPILEGVIVPMLTPFKDNEEIDEKALRQLTNWLIDNGVHGLFPNSSMGEFAKLFIEERKRVIDIVVDETNGRVPVLPGTGDVSTKIVMDMTKYAKDAGVDAVVVVSPYYGKPMEEALFNHYKFINDNIDIPIVVYDIPTCTGYSIKPELAARLADLDNVIAFKDSSGDMNKVLWTIQYVGDKISILQGFETLFVPTLLMGAQGGILGTANWCPRFMVDMYDTFKRGEIKEAAEMQKKLLQAIYILRKNNLSAKQAAGLQGISLGRSRKPSLPPKVGHEEDVRKSLIKLGVL